MADRRSARPVRWLQWPLLPGQSEKLLDADLIDTLYFSYFPYFRVRSLLMGVENRQNQPMGYAEVDDLVAHCGRRPQLLPSSDAVAAYRLVYRRIDALLRGRADVAELKVPACPAWTIRQAVAHLAGVADDIVSLNMEGKGTEQWTAAQVDRLGSKSIDDLLDLWGQTIDPVTELLSLVPEGSGCQLVFDTLTHEYDIRGALNEPGCRTGDLAFEVALAFMTTTYDRMARQTGLPAVRLTTPTMGTVQLGDPDTATDRLVLHVSEFEYLRAFGGRRSVRQVMALPWHGDPTNLLPACSNDATRPRRNDLEE
ncbi:maleylpyruvate isomerase family mycothiol-dependent enzyme [Mycobacterium numidiamassiliense]|nr:maleylpyruvate isomerase family mycothiol-dependent enzyme [Mycobacterium numidiamassiliense]